ncbi:MULTISPECIES: hypothetical protein [Candidatus Ichthyocystis]|uniref:Uncharacterized protein n=1 Tax=Candidatus Ichthyocystis hellenicum TaxID=1561003 RepID=A0A0S4M3V3_9BURK|nr:MULTISPECIES: hypothetical protein [Ichthyocystis]CUT17679.1 hypothetical protein Ark11_0856 [Candidatus Ichthyocystis hellenicum]
MYNLDVDRNNAQGDYDRLPVEDSVCQHPLELLDVGYVDSSINNLTADDRISNIFSSSDQLSQDLCDWYRYSGNFEITSGFCEDNFLQEFTAKCGYKITEGFLSVMNKHKIDFMDKVDSILICLQSSFCFLNESDCSLKNIMILLCKAGFYFTKKVHRLRSKCIDILQFDFIPMIIKSVFCSKVIDGNYEREMTYYEMEQLFLHFVSTLECLVMHRVIKYWRDFCNSNKDLLSKISSSDYINPFIYANSFNEINVPGITHSAAFTNKFGVYISLMAITKIDEIIDDFVNKVNIDFKKSVRSKCSCIFNYSDKFHYDIKELRGKIKFLIKEEINKKVEEGIIKDEIINFLKETFVLNKCGGVEKDKSSIICSIIDYMRNLLVCKSTNNSYDIIKVFQRKMTVYEKRLLTGKKYSNTIKSRWNLKLHPDDDNKILSIRRKFCNEYRKIIKDKFCAMLKESHKFLDGTVIEMVHWNKISKNLFPISQEAVRPLIIAEYEEISKLLPDMRIVEDIYVFDGYFAGTRKATNEEKDSILKTFTNHEYRRNWNLSNKVWRELTDSKSINVSKEVASGVEVVEFEKDITSSASSIHTVDGGELSSSLSSAQTELPVVSLMSAGLKDKVVNSWGLNVHPDDSKLILFIRRKFSIQLIDHITKLFCGMLRSKTILPSGVILRDSSWTLISNELSAIALKSVEHITKRQHEELDIALSKSRIVEINEDGLSCAIRNVTDVEKKDLMDSIKKFMDRRLRESIRLSWVRMVSKYSSDIGYGYREKSKCITGSGREGSWGVKLRYSDNIAILNTRKKFSSKIKDIIHDKFTSMLKNRYKFDDGTFIGIFAWPKVSKKLISIAKNEIEPILADQREELEKVISRARVVIGSFDREVTCEENSIILENITNLVCGSLKKLFRKIWNGIITLLKVDFVGKGNSSPVNIVDISEVDVNNRDDSLIVRLCYEDDLAISNIKRKISSKIYDCIGNKFSKIIKSNHQFGDNITISTCYWKKISKIILPIAKEQIGPLLEKERIKISDLLLESHADISSFGDHSESRVLRDLTFYERSIIMEGAIKSIRKNVFSNLGRIWNRIIKLQSINLIDLREIDRSEFDNIRIEFIGILGPIVNEAVSDLRYTNSDIYSVVYERSRNLFNERGFINRVESLLSEAQIVDKYENNKFLTDEERKKLLKDFMDIIDTDRDCLIKKRVSILY